MERNRDGRRATVAASNGLSRRRHRSGFRDSQEEDGAMEMQETARLRDRGSGKKNRDRDRERDRLSRSKRRGERSIHGSNRDDSGDATSEESVNDEEDDGDDGGGAASSMRMLPPNTASLSFSSISSHHQKSFLPPLKVLRAARTWKVADEMIGVSVPRKARSASTKRSNECLASVGIGGEQIHRQTSTSPVRPSLAVVAVASRPVSPSSSNASVRKKMKSNVQKPRPPKSSLKSSSSAQDEIEFEIAEVLFGMMRQPLCPSKQELISNESTKLDSRDSGEPLKSSNDAKSRASSPISNSAFCLTQLSPNLLQNSAPSNPPTAAVAPKRKRLRPVTYAEDSSNFTGRNYPVSMTNTSDIDQTANTEIAAPNFEKLSGSKGENNGASYNLSSSQAADASLKLEFNPKPMTDESVIEDMDMTKESQSLKMESNVLILDGVIENMTVPKANSAISGLGNTQEDKFQIDLMASPPLRLSPEGEIDLVARDPKPLITSVEKEVKPEIKEDENNLIKSKKFKEGSGSTEAEGKKVKVTGEEVESPRPIVMEKMIDQQLDLEKTDSNIGNSSASTDKLNKHVEKRQPPPPPGNSENTGALSLPMSVASCPGGLPPMGYMAPVQGVVSIDGGNLSSASIKPPHLLFTQPCPRRCATHCYIARNICYHQQFTRMNPFWPAATCSASVYGAKACNPNVVPSINMHGDNAGSNVNTNIEKGHDPAMFPSHAGKEKGSQAPNTVDNAERKQIMLQPALPPGISSNILHGPAFIFPLSQQQAAASACVRPGPAKSSSAGCAASSTSNSATVGAPATPLAVATEMSFNYPNMPGNETQYLAILQNNGFPYPITAHVGSPPAYRGSHAHAMPFFNGSFYPSQILHPSQIQQPQPPATQSMQSQHGHQNTSISSGSSSSQKHMQNKQHRPHEGGINGGSGSLQGFPAPKNQSSQQFQQQQQRQNRASHQMRQLETEMDSEDSPATADSRVSRANMSIYGQNFALPIHPPNFALMNPASLGANGVVTATGNHGDKKHHQQQQQLPQQQGSKSGIDALHSQAFAMSFASINGATAPGLDISSFAQNHAILQSLPEATRHNFHTMATNAAAQAAQQKKNYRVSEGKGDGGDSSIREEERKSMGVKAPPATVGQSIVFSRPDLTETASAIPSNVMDTSRNLNLGSASTNASGSAMPTATSVVNVSNSRQQLQRAQQQQQHQHQQMLHLHKQHQIAAAAPRSKTAATSNVSAYSENLPSSLAGNFSTLSTFPQNLVQSSSSCSGQSPQWKNSVRMTTSQAPSQSHVPSTPSSLKNLPQQQSRPHQNPTQISFAGNPKLSTTQQVQQPLSSNMSSPPMQVSSPTTSVSRRAGGSPSTAPSAPGNKAGQASLSNQPARNSSPVPNNSKSSPVGGRNFPSNPSATASGAVPMPHLSQHPPQQQLPKQALQQAQMFFNNYMQAQAAHSTSTTHGTSGTREYYLQRRPSDQQQQPQGTQAPTSNGMLSLCTPVTLVNASISDPTKPVLAAPGSSNMKGGGLSAQGLVHGAQYALGPHSVFPYPQIFPNVVQVKPPEQKQPAGE